MGIRKLLVAFIFILGSTQVFSQYSDFKYKKKNHSSEPGFLNATKQSRYLTIGGGLNLFTYFGDLTPNEKLIKNAFKITRPGVSACVNYNYLPNLFFKGELSYGRITGDDFNADPYGQSTRKYVRNLNFKNDLVGLTLAANANIFRDPFEYYKRRKFNIYFNAGISIWYSNPKGKVIGSTTDGGSFERTSQWVALRPLGTEGQNNPDLDKKKYSTIQLGIPLGAGVRIKLGYRMDLYLEASIQYLLTDYIDDIGTSYVDLGALDSDQARKMSDRSRESVAAVKEEPRDMDIIRESTTNYQYVSEYDGETYNVFQGFGMEGGTRGGSINDLIAITSFKFSYIFTN